MGKISEGIETLKTVGFKVFVIRVYNYSMVKLKRVIHGYDKENIKRFNELKNKYVGQRIFILGNGPSLNEMPLYLLKSEHTMCFNRFFLMTERLNWKPEFFCITDNLLVRDMGKEINETILPNVKYAFFPDIHPSNVNFRKYVNAENNVYWLYADNPNFSTNLPWCGINKTVVNASIQIAAYLGFSEIYLLGVDMTFGDSQKVKKTNSRDWVAQEDDNNHFDPRYFSKGRSFHNPTVEVMQQRFEICRNFFANKGVKIYNAGYGGKLRAFPRVKYEDVLNIDEIQEKKIFEDLLHSINAELTLYDFQKVEQDVNGNFKVDKTLGAKIVKDYILTHVPIGPYKDEYYFVKRKEI